MYIDGKGTGRRVMVRETIDEPVLEVTRVAKTYTDHPEGTVALDTISFVVHPGEFVSVVGPSGSGKSTLLRIVADLIPPSSGTVRVCGLDARSARQERLFGIVFQDPVLFEWRTVLANVELPLEVAGLPRSERRERAMQTLGLVGLADFRNRYPRQLSGGMQRRVAIARALVVRPRLLLLDEPFGALDEMARERLNLELLRLWSETGVTVLFVSHLIAESVLLADRVLVLTPRPGRIAAKISVDLARPRDADTRASSEFFDLVNRVRSALRGVVVDSEP